MNRVRKWRGMLSTKWQALNPLIRLRLVVLIGLGAAAIVTSLTALASGERLSGLLLNLASELAGAFVTFIVFDQLIGSREKHESEILAQARLKTDLIAQLRSKDNATAIRAAEELGRHGWLYDGSLRGADLAQAHLPGAPLAGANLQGTDLWDANLQGACLTEVNLQGAHLWNADLQGACLRRADLQRAHLRGADLQGTDLTEANLHGAYLRGAHLQRAILAGANLQEASLEKATIDETTTLPDGTQWTPTTDMARFTDPDYARSGGFWRSIEPCSPACQGRPAGK
jgi:hypothetical protein